MIDAAKRFLAAHARVLDRRRFERLFEDGAPEPVRDAVAAYRNAELWRGCGRPSSGPARSATTTCSAPQPSSTPRPTASAPSARCGGWRPAPRRPPLTQSTHTALGLSPRPGTRTRGVLGAVDEDLDRLAAGQSDDGGWTFPWAAWSRVADAEWRGSVTVDALLTLRENGRLLINR